MSPVFGWMFLAFCVASRRSCNSLAHPRAASCPHPATSRGVQFWLLRFHVVCYVNGEMSQQCRIQSKWGNVALGSCSASVWHQWFARTFLPAIFTLVSQPPAGRLLKYFTCSTESHSDTNFRWPSKPHRWRKAYYSPLFLAVSNSISLSASSTDPSWSTWRTPGASQSVQIQNVGVKIIPKCKKKKKNNKQTKKSPWAIMVKVTVASGYYNAVVCVCKMEPVGSAISLVVICSLQSFSDRAFLPAVLLNLLTCLAPVWGPWQRSSFAGTGAEGPLPTAAGRLSSIPACGLWREHAKQGVHLCGCAIAEWKRSWRLQTGGSGRAAVQPSHGWLCRKDRVVDADAGFVNRQIIVDYDSFVCLYKQSIFIFCWR